MSWINIINGEGGASVRTKINNAMTAIFDSLTLPFWEDVSGTNKIQPKDAKSIQAVLGEFDGLAAGSGGALTVEGSDIKFPYFQFEGAGVKMLAVSTDGIITVVSPDEDEGTQPLSQSTLATTNQSSHDITLVTPTILVFNESNNIDLQLPGGNIMGGQVTVRKCRDNAYSVTINTTASHPIYYNEQAYTGLTTTTHNAYIQLRAFRHNNDPNQPLIWTPLIESSGWAGINPLY